MYLCTRNYDLKRGGTFETAKAGTFHSVTAGTSIPLFTLEYDKIIKNLNNEYVLVELCIFMTIFVVLKRLIRVCGDRAFSILSKRSHAFFLINR